MTTNYNFVLLKFFSKEEYLNDFINGSLYMNTLSFFWNHEKPYKALNVKEEFCKEHPNINPNAVLIKIDNNLTAGQTDLYEGVTKTKEVPNEVKEFFKLSNVSNMAIRPNGLSYCNCLSFYKLYPNKSHSKYYIDRNNLETLANDFGRFVVIIKDQKEFLNRVDNTIDGVNCNTNCKFNYLFKSVEYSDRGLGLDKLFNKDRIDNSIADRGVFVKNKCYKNQSEYRLALYRGLKTKEAYKLQIGNIKDICISTDVNYLNDSLKKIKKPKDITSIDEHGNSSKKELIDLFVNLTDNEYEESFVLY